jgi:hypothetical protein
MRRVKALVVLFTLGIGCSGSIEEQTVDVASDENSVGEQGMFIDTVPTAAGEMMFLRLGAGRVGIAESVDLARGVPPVLSRVKELDVDAMSLYLALSDEDMYSVPQEIMNDHLRRKTKMPDREHIARIRSLATDWDPSRKGFSAYFSPGDCASLLPTNKTQLCRPTWLADVLGQASGGCKGREPVLTTARVTYPTTGGFVEMARHSFFALALCPTQSGASLRANGADRNTRQQYGGEISLPVNNLFLMWAQNGTDYIGYTLEGFKSVVYSISSQQEGNLCSHTFTGTCSLSGSTTTSRFCGNC